MSRTAASRALPASIWALGIVSLFMDLSSEMIHSLLPVFMVTVLGASTLSVGIIEGFAEATAQIAKIFSGALSDRMGRRKPLVLLGYGLAALTKPLFPLAGSIGWVFAARFLDRIGKGIRGAPRDALIADITPPAVRGAAYGLRQSLDTVGAIAGPAAAMLLMVLFAGSFRAVFWVATIPALACVAILWFGVSEPERKTGTGKRQAFPRWRDLNGLGGVFWSVVAVGAVMTLARFSEAFLILRAQGLGLPIAQIPLVLVVLNVVYAATSYPVGRLGDSQNRSVLLTVGLIVLIAADLLLAHAPDLKWVMGGVVLWGLHMGFTQGLLAAMIADAAPETARGSAFGLFYLVNGLALLVASALAGGLWQWVGPAATFVTGAGFAALAIAGLLYLRRFSTSLQ